MGEYILIIRGEGEFDSDVRGTYRSAGQDSTRAIVTGTGTHAIIDGACTL